MRVGTIDLLVKLLLWMLLLGKPVLLENRSSSYEGAQPESKPHILESSNKCLEKNSEESAEVMSRFDDLVDEILLEILKQCDGKSIAKLQCANRRMLLLGNLGTVWKESLLNHYGLHVPDAMGTSYTIFRDIYRELIDEDQIDTRLPFRGLQTDGGMCKGDGSYWVDNMFHHNVRSHYRSSSMGPSGIRCIGLHAPNYKTASKLSLRQLKPIHSLQTTYRASTVVKRQDEVQVDCRLNSIAANMPSSIACLLIRKVQVCKSGGLFFRPVERGAVLLGSRSSVSKGSDPQSSDALAHGLYSQTVSPLVSMINGFVNLATILVAYQNGKIPKPTRVGVEVGDAGAGEWVEFGNCAKGSNTMSPVVWFRFYSSTERMNGWTRERSIQTLAMKSKFLAIGTSFLQVKANANDLKHSCGLLNMPLMHPCMGDAVCTLLSSSESMLPDIIDVPAEENYVEVNHVWLFGKEVQARGHQDTPQLAVDPNSRFKTNMYNT